MTSMGLPSSTRVSYFVVPSISSLKLLWWNTYHIRSFLWSPKENLFAGQMTVYSSLDVW